MGKIEILIVSYLIIGIALSAIFGIAAISLDVKIASEYRGNFYLACDASTPEQIVEYLEKYLEDTKDFHGYTSILYKNPSTDIDEQRKIVQSFLDRATSLADKKSFEEQRLDVQMGLGTLKTDMTNDDMDTNHNDLRLIRWHMLHCFGGLFAYIGFFLMAIWWWTLILLVGIEIFFFW